MKWLKKGLFLMLTLGIVVAFWACATGQQENTVPEETTSASEKAEHKKDPANFVEFSRSTEPRQKYVSIPELLEYESKYSDCNSTWFRDQLSGEDLIIYNSYLYALENRFTWFMLYVEDSDKDFSYVREMLSLDSPFLEQNYSDYERIWKQPINYIGERISVGMEQFTDSRWEMKMEALDKCRQIVQNIPPEYQTQQAKMEYLYDYVCDNVEYVEYESMADESYFYDAVCKGQTVCDGYSNMLLLLFRLIGVECCEAMGYDEEGQSGHTWVVAKLDGTFYNFDPTFEDSSQIKSNRRVYFGFSDELAGVRVIEQEEKRPKCANTSRDFIYADIIVTSLTARKEVQKIVELSEKRLVAGHKTTLVGVKKTVDTKAQELFFDRFFDYSTRSKGISLSRYIMRRGTLVEITLERR